MPDERDIDGIEQRMAQRLEALGTTLMRGGDPVAARARGDRRRRRRRLATGAAGLAALAVTAIVVVASTDDQTTGLDVVGPPSTTAPSTPSSPTSSGFTIDPCWRNGGNIAGQIVMAAGKPELRPYIDSVLAPADRFDALVSPLQESPITARDAVPDELDRLGRMMAPPSSAADGPDDGALVSGPSTGPDGRSRYRFETFYRGAAATIDVACDIGKVVRIEWRTGVDRPAPPAPPSPTPPSSSP